MRTRRVFTIFFSKNVLQSVLVYDDGDDNYVDDDDGDGDCDDKANDDGYCDQ